MAGNRMTYADKEGLIAWTALAGTLTNPEITNIEGRFAAIPGGKRDLALMRSLADKYIAKLMKVMGMSKSDADDFMKCISTMKIYTGILGRYGHEPVNSSRDFGSFFSYKDQLTLFESAGYRCFMCQKSEAEAKSCPLRRVFDKMELPDMPEDATSCFCEEQRRFGEILIPGADSEDKTERKKNVSADKKKGGKKK